MSENDRACVKLCLNGHPDAYGQLVKRYQAPLLSFLSGRMGGRERAEEAAQETLVRAFFALGKLRRTRSFFPWLLGIARRVAKEHHRAESRYRRALSLAPSMTKNARPHGDHALQQALAGLPGRYADVVLLRYYGGLSCAQVAERLGIPLGTATKRLSRAYRLLREALGRNETTTRHKESEVRA